MAYTKLEWRDDDPTTPLTAARLTYHEDGIAGAHTIGETAQTRADSAYTLAQQANAEALQSETDARNASIPRNVVTTSGDLIVGTGPSAVTRIAKGLGGSYFGVDAIDGVQGYHPLAEDVRGILRGALVAGTNVTLSYSPDGTQITVSSTASGGGGGVASNLPVVEHTAGKTLQAADLNTYMRMRTAGPVEVVVPVNTALSVPKDTVVVVRAVSFDVTVRADNGATTFLHPSTGIVLKPHTACTLVKIDNSNGWDIV